MPRRCTRSWRWRFAVRREKVKVRKRRRYTKPPQSVSAESLQLLRLLKGKRLTEQAHPLRPACQLVVNLPTADSANYSVCHCALEDERRRRLQQQIRLSSQSQGRCAESNDGPIRRKSKLVS